MESQFYYCIYKGPPLAPILRQINANPNSLNFSQYMVKFL